MLVLGRRPVATANAIAQLVPDATVHLLAARPVPPGQQVKLRPNVAYQLCETIADRVAYLSIRPQPELIIERGNNLQRQKTACFRQLFPFVAPGGAYVVESLRVRPDDDRGASSRDIGGLLSTLAEIRSGGSRTDDNKWTIDLAQTMADIEYHANAAVVTKAIAYQFKLRDSSANAVLESRFGPAWGEVLDVRPAYQWTGNSTVITHGEGPDHPRRPVFEVPPRYVRRYDDVQCWNLQRLRFGDYWLPDTFRHPQNERLTHRRLVTVSPDMARLTQGPPGPTRSASGPFFYFDTEYPGHFGHVLTEVVSRYRGWQTVRALVPDVRPLVSLSRGQVGMPSFQRAVFTALGVDPDDVEYIRPAECLAVQTLYASTPEYVMPQYVAPDLAEIWDTIRVGCERPEGPLPDRLFVARRPRPIRTCRNAEEVEDMFSRLGFELFYPEDHDFGHQVAAFRHAKVIAGFGGSGMFSSMFAPGTTVITINGDTYTATNEEMIRAVVGGDIHYFWGDSEIKHPRDSWSWDAYQSNFTFDVDRFASELKEIVEQPAAG